MVKKIVFAIMTLMFAGLQSNASASDAVNNDSLSPMNVESSDTFTIHVGGGFNIVWNTHRALQEKADFKCAKKGFNGGRLVNWQCTDNSSGSGKAIVECY